MGRPFTLAWGLLKSFGSGDILKDLYQDIREGPPLHELGQVRPKHQGALMDKRRELERTSPEDMDESPSPLTDEQRRRLIERVITPRPSPSTRQSTLEEFA